MLACIGDHFTMGPDRAAEAAKLVKAKQIVPMHFGTFPVLTGTPERSARRSRRLAVDEADRDEGRRDDHAVIRGV